MEEELIRMKVFDLSLPFSVEMSVFPGTPPMKYQLTHTVEKDHYNLGLATINSHAGTHTDAPRHFLADGASLGDVPLERYVGNAVVVDCTAKGAPFASIEKEDFVPYEALIREHGKVLVKTGWSRYADQQRYYTDYPVVTESCADYLVSLGVHLVGVEAPSLNPEKYIEVHKILLKHNVAIVESLTNLDKLPSTVVFFSGAPLSLAGGDGFPIRAYAIVF